MTFPDRIERTVTLTRAPREVWHALTTAEGLSAWFGERASIDLRPGGSATMTFAGGMTVEMRVERVEEPTVFAYTWRLPDLPEDDPRRTYVEFTLEPNHDGTLLRTMPCPVPPRDRHRLRGARRAPATPPPAAGPVTVQRRVSQRGQIMVATQRIQVGLIHARKIVTVTAEDDQFRLVIDGEMIGAVPRMTTREVQRFKAYTRHSAPPLNTPGREGRQR